MAVIQILGSGDAFGSGGRFQTCFWLEWSGKNILIDCGATSSVAFKRDGRNITEIDAILISHLHGDHIGGIPFLLMELAHSTKNFDHKIAIFGPEGVKECIRNLQECMYPGSLEYTDDITNFYEYSGKDDFSDFSIETFDVNHSELSKPKGLRVSNSGKVFAFSGDGDWSDNLLKLSTGADLFICECFNFEMRTPGHLSYKKLMEKKQEIDCQNLHLNHPGPELLENIDKVELPLIHDSQIIEF